MNKLSNSVAPTIEGVGKVRGAQVLVAVGLSIVLAMIAGFVTAYVLPRIAPSWGSADRLAAVIVAEVYTAIIVGHLIAFRGLHGMREQLRLRSASASQITAASALWVAGLLAAAVVYFALSPFLWPLTYVRDALMWIGADGGRLASGDPLLVALGIGRAVILAPVAEELLFRGSLFGWLRQLVSRPAAIVITASLFALIHLLPVLWPVAFFFGVSAAWYREQADSLIPFIVVHMVNNIALIVASYIFTGWNVPNMM